MWLKTNDLLCVFVHSIFIFVEKNKEEKALVSIAKQYTEKHR